MQLLIAYPAYGRMYLTREAAVADFKAGRDFSATPQGGPYFSYRDFQTSELSGFDGVIFYLHTEPLLKEDM